MANSAVSPCSALSVYYSADKELPCLKGQGEDRLRQGDRPVTLRPYSKGIRSLRSKE